ncbi:hypothetical protein SRHO_G00064820 [Serrasalmus rhombeus]
MCSSNMWIQMRAIRAGLTALKSHEEDSGDRGTMPTVQTSISTGIIGNSETTAMSEADLPYLHTFPTNRSPRTGSRIPATNGPLVPTPQDKDECAFMIHDDSSTFNLYDFWNAMFR